MSRSQQLDSGLQDPRPLRISKITQNSDPHSRQIFPKRLWRAGNADCINRWAARDAMGQMIKEIENELAAIDDRTFRWSIKRPYPKMLLALGKFPTPCCFVMPARIAATDPFKQISD